MRQKYSDNFERDYKFYLENISHFKFCGTLTPKFTAISDPKGKSAKEAFYLIDSTGKNYPTFESQILDDILTCKASVNFHIKQWAEGRADGTLPFSEFAGDGETLEWKLENDEPIPIYHKSMAIRYGFPDWVIRAVEQQKIKLIESDKTMPDWFKHAAKTKQPEAEGGKL